MIQYSLKCAEGHQFDSWFQSASAYDKLRGTGHVACAICGTDKVEKALMAPRVGSGDKTEPSAETALTAPKSPAELALAALKAHVEANSDYVGPKFAAEARAINDGDAPERPIWGEAKPEEAKALVDEGIKIAPLPFTPTRKIN